MLDFCLFCIVEYFAMASRTIMGIVGILCATHRDGFISAEEIRGAVKVVNAQAWRRVFFGGGVIQSSRFSLSHHILKGIFSLHKSMIKYIPA